MCQLAIDELQFFLMRSADASRALQLFDQIDDHSGREREHGAAYNGVGPSLFSGWQVNPIEPCQGADQEGKERRPARTKICDQRDRRKNVMKGRRPGIT